MKIIWKLLGCTGDPADGGTADTQVHKANVSKLFKNWGHGMTKYLDTFSTTQNGLNHGRVWKTYSFSFEHKVYGVLLEALLRKQKFDQIFYENELRKSL